MQKLLKGNVQGEDGEERKRIIAGDSSIGVTRQQWHIHYIQMRVLTVKSVHCERVKRSEMEERYFKDIERERGRFDIPMV